VKINIAVLLAGCLAAAPAAAQTWPARTVRIVVPFPPSGGADAMARMLATRLGEHTGGTFIVDNRPGGGGVLAAEIAARAAPDGHTLLMAATEFGTNPAVRPKLPYDAFKDFTHLSVLATLQNLLASHPAVPAKNVKQLIALAKAQPGRLTYGSTGTGGGPHLAGELLQIMSGIRWTHVPFKGAAAGSVALMSGEIDFMFSSTAGLLPHVKSGRVHAVAVTGPKRFAELPDVPTVAESGVPGYSVMGWYGLYAPAALPQALARRIHTAATEAMSSPDVKEKLARIGLDHVMSSPEEHVAFLRAEVAQWTKVVKAANLRIE
jgi:tripartite-type tricarboxylate transporter receptor subunit TctC